MFQNKMIFACLLAFLAIRYLMFGRLLTGIMGLVFAGLAYYYYKLHKADKAKQAELALLEVDEDEDQDEESISDEQVVDAEDQAQDINIDDANEKPQEIE